MNRTKEIKDRLDKWIASSSFDPPELYEAVLDNAPADIEYLLTENERLTKAISEFVEKHFHGGSKANRDDYVGLGIPTADIYKLREAIKKSPEPERGGLVNPDGGDYPLKWMAQNDKV